MSRDNSADESARAHETGGSPSAAPPAPELPAEMEEALSGLPESKRSEIIAVVRYRLQFFKGPLPPPNILRAYENAYPGCADKIIDWADRSIRHEHDTERRRQETDHKLLLRGQGTSFAVAMSALVGGCVLAALGSPVIGAILSIGSLVGCAALYIRGEFQHRQNSEKQRRS